MILIPAQVTTHLEYMCSPQHSNSVCVRTRQCTCVWCHLSAFDHLVKIGEVFSMSYLNKTLLQYCPLVLTFLRDLTAYNLWQVHMMMQQQKASNANV